MKNAYFVVAVVVLGAAAIADYTGIVVDDFKQIFPVLNRRFFDFEPFLIKQFIH